MTMRSATATELQAEARMKFSLDHGTKVCDFTLSNRPVDFIEGPLGSGKTKAMCVRIMRHAQEQVTSPVDGMRYSRFALVRNTYPDLRRTTVRTWLETFPEHLYGRFNWAQPLTHKIKFGDVRMEVDFLALDKPEDVRKLRSTEYTGIAFNELPFIEKELFDEADSRLRYPPPEHGGPNPWRGVIADGNAPDEDHWIALMTGQVDFPPGMTQAERDEYKWPDEWGFYMQPPAVLEKLDERGNVVGYDLNPGAENLKNLPGDYYTRMLRGKQKSWIDSRLRNVVTLVVEGSPVWPMFRRESHVTREPLRPVAGYPVNISLDFGRQPAAVFMQAVNNRVLVQNELIGLNEGAVTFAPKVKRMLAEKYPGADFIVFGDPKGADKTQTDERSAYDIFAGLGMKVLPPPGLKMNEIAKRVDTVAYALNEMYDGTPRVRISPLCRTLIVGCAGRYFNERDETGELRPCKNRYSHVCFVAGTKIAAARGDVPIESLCIGDMVTTPYGSKPVIAIGNRTCNTVMLRFNSGTGIQCTADHPFWTQRGWVAASELRETDACCALSSLLRSGRTGRSIRFMNLTASAIIGKDQIVTGTASIAAAFTSKFGRKITATFRRAMTFTTSMKTKPTTILKIWNACRKATIIASTCSIPNGLKNPKLISNWPARLSFASAAPIQHGHPIFAGLPEWQQNADGGISQRKFLSVFNAGKNSRAIPSVGNVDFAQPHVKAPRAAPLASMMWSAFVSLARLLSKSINTQRQKPVRLVARENGGLAQVYNITVDEAHCYYANGILVSNCDAWQYGMIGLGEGRRMIGMRPAGEAHAMRVYKGRQTMRRITA